MRESYWLRPHPWRSFGSRNPDLARLVGAVHRQRRHVVAWYPMVPAPPARVGGLEHPSGSSCPVGALILLWKGWRYFRCPCPRCGGRGLGVSATGGLTTGQVIGVCCSCGAMLERHVSGIVTITSGIQPVLERAHFRTAGGSRPGKVRTPAALLAVLGKLGEIDLPDPRSAGLSLFHDPTSRIR